MEGSERMNPKEAKRMTDLAGRIFAAIESETGHTYKEVMFALDCVRKDYEEKGRDYLDSVSVQEIAGAGGLQGEMEVFYDKNNDTLTLVYDAGSKSVYVKED